MYIPEKRKNRQITLFDFNQSCGMELDSNNEWIKLAHAIPWSKMEAKYVAMFPSKTGRPATPFRMALGVLIIQKRKKLSDRAVIKEIQENPYLQYFLGMEKFSHQTPMNRYKERTGHYPKRVLVDQIYRTRDNRNFCKDHNITMSGPKLGRLSKDKKSTKEEYQDNTDRIEVERFFSTEKHCNGAGLIMTKLEETTLSSIAMSVLVTNLFAVDLAGIFLLYFSDNISSEKTEHYIIIDDVV